jgi:eukaryotic-like serine/threonine-protein kinase
VPLLAGARLGPYEVLSPLAAGGMGEVYRARDPRLERDVAVKVVASGSEASAERLRRFEQEARAIAALNHPHILAIHDVGSENGISYVVFELLEGQTLYARLAHGSVPARKAVEYGMQIGRGLAAAHARNIIHRDLKPENLFLTSDGQVKILDFGLAKLTEAPDAGSKTDAATRQTATEAGLVVGTAGYMSPEQARGRRADARSDNFAMGAILYEMLSGRPAFEGETAADRMSAILHHDPPDLASAAGEPVSPGLERIVRRCLEKDPEERFQTARDVAFALDALAVVSGTRPTHETPAMVKGGRVFGAAALILLCFIAGVLADRAVRKTPPAEPPTYRRLTFDRGTVRRARFAPDSHTVVYSAAWRGEPSEVFATRLDGRESRPLGLPGLLHSVSSTGELAVGLGIVEGDAQSPATLARVPLAGGAPREVLESVTWADWSPDGAELAVVRVLEETQRVEFPIGRVLYETKGQLSHLRVSPRGDWLAFVEIRLAGAAFSGGSLVAVDRSGAKRVLSGDWADLFGLAWRPDGHEVWFTAGRLGEFKALRAVTLDGQERLVARLLGQIDLEDVARDGRVLLTHPNLWLEITALAPGAAKERDLTWLGLSQLADLSNDGRRVLFTELPEGAGEGGWTYLRKTDGSSAVRLGEGVALALSPNGKWALSVLTSPSRLVLLPTGVGEAKTLTRPGLTYLGEGAWFPDGRRVVFTAEAHGGPAHAYVQDIEGGEPRSIGPSGISVPIIAPDGRTIAALAQDRMPILFSIDGGEPRPCPGLESTDRLIRWSADGRALFFMRYTGLTAEVHRLELATGRKKLLWKLAARDPVGAYRPHVVALSADGKSYAHSFQITLSDLYLVDGLK